MSKRNKKSNIKIKPINKNKIIKKKKAKNFLSQIVENNVQNQRNECKKPASLREKMMEKLKGARFRYINEQLYTRGGQDSVNLFRSDPGAYKSYHDGYRQQVKRWPFNPLDKIINEIKEQPINISVADFGCGEAKLAASVQQKVHSFDLVASNSKVTACDMAHCPLPDASVDVAVFCLSLMGTNIHDYLMEANRVLKIGGMLKIAEVESRFEKCEEFVEAVEKFGFSNVSKELSYRVFYFFDFKKIKNIKNKTKLPTVSLSPCFYKKR